MADQETHVNDVTANEVVVAPTQINLGGPRSRGWMEALLQGPLTQVDRVDEAERAHRLAEASDPAAAAEVFESIASTLEAHDYAPAAEIYRVRAAGAHADAQNRTDARRLYLELARSTVGDGSLEASAHARRAAEQSTPDESWEANGLLGRAAWPERLPDDIGTVRAAWDQTKKSAAEVEWAAALVELLILTGDDVQARGVAAEVRERHELTGGDRLALELDYLDALDEPETALTGWDEVTRWATDPRRGIEASATVWQRRGVAYARTGELEAAQGAFLHAAAQWSREPGYDDQVAEAYFSGLNARLISGDLTALQDEGRSLAGSLRGSEATATSETQRLLRQSREALLADKFPDAFRLSSVATAISRRAGNLSDFLKANECLGDALMTASHSGPALQAYIAAGVPEKTKALTEGSSADQVLEAVDLDGPAWERRAAWAAVAGTKRNASDEAADLIAERALARRSAHPRVPSLPTRPIMQVKAWVRSYAGRGKRSCRTRWPTCGTAWSLGWATPSTWPTRF